MTEPQTARRLTKARLHELFARDAERALALMEGAADVKTLTPQFHAMKSALSALGEASLSEYAARLERAGRTGDEAFVAAGLSGFLDGLRALLKAQRADNEKAAAAREDYDALRGRLGIIKEACAAYDKKTARDALDALERVSWPPRESELLRAMAGYLLDGDYGALAEAVIQLEAALRA
jgi:HPt (histidine-containing phosphotransfer) domain-containing protein